MTNDELRTAGPANELEFSIRQSSTVILHFLFAIILFTTLTALAQKTEVQFLSGHDKDDAVPWRFFCTTGAQSGYWTNLVVPSNWELHGFGALTYHRDPTNPETGLYEHDFNVPASWKNRRIFLVFDGAMTDTSTKLNGQSAGPIHQGGYYRFKYEVTKLLKFGAGNKLEVTVAKHSANTTVNGAERTGDYWMYGGIFRPVYLEAEPQQFIERVAIDAKADGNFSADVFLDGATNADEVEAQIQTLDGKKFGESFYAGISCDLLGAGFSKLKAQIPLPKLWTAETPNLYKVQVRFLQKGKVIHQIEQRFGFRTFEVRDGDGLYLNGRRVILKGCDRHSFWPDSGRCLSEAVHRLDIETMKDMNMNAVRMSHYPPDAEFLDLCDELGLYVLDELGGWHHFYDTATGTKLVGEMVARDVNHPCILFWDNGNEGGFNTNLDKIFGEFDPQQRRVLHPWAPFDGVNTAHYLPYDFARLACDGWPITFRRNQYFADTNSTQKWIYMPTEFLHGLYDGGAGAGLADAWDLMSRSKYIGGGFIWAFLDEGVRRVDTGKIDVSGNEAPDGIVGPYREREASFYAIKQIWSPIQILETNLPENFDGTLTVENHFSFTDASHCKFEWQLRRFIYPNRADSGDETVSAKAVADSPEIPPGGRGELHLNLPENFWHTSDVTEGDFLAVRVDDPNGRELWTYVWPLRQRKVLSDEANIVAHAENFGGTNSGVIELKGKGLVARIDNGELIEVERNGKKFSLSNGPRIAATNSILKKVSWQLRGDGWLQCDYTYAAEGTNDYFGVIFDYPENLVKSKRWLGDGPFRVWKNRLAGATLGVWRNDYNNTITGWRDWIYPEFKGCFANVHWLQLNTTEGQITVVPENIPFVQVLTPEFPPEKLAGHTIPPLPKCGIGFLDAIPPIGSKFNAPEAGGPSGEHTVAHGDYHGSVSFYFGKLP
jgi:Glycosyl hydrolases family 2, TIM barrel domain/Glycosyl hydrolases family 2, sugar binding domain/Glycosyl hydrolases family 2/Beta galactosidase small chain